jgi:GTP cyclohydrolase I
VCEKCDEVQLATSSQIDVARIEAAVKEILEAIGEDPTRPGIVDTPKRVAKWWREFIGYNPGSVGTTFEDASAGVVMVSGMRVWSMCEHHLLPFWCDVTVAYKPAGKVLGLSKFARIAHKHAHRPQLQERLVTGIAEEVIERTGSRDVAVVGHGEHLCMTARGIRTPSIMTSMALHGQFETDVALRQIVLDQARTAKGVM